MALKLSAIAHTGLYAQDAYHRVESVSLEGKTGISFRVRSYSSSKTEYDAFADRLFSCDYGLTGPNPIAQAYEYLKSLPEFAGAIDC